MGKKEDVYDEQIASKVSEIIEICEEHDIGMVMDFELDNDGTEENPNYLHCSTALPGDGEKIRRAARAVAPRQAQIFGIAVGTDSEDDS